MSSRSFAVDPTLGTELEKRRDSERTPHPGRAGIIHKTLTSKLHVRAAAMLHRSFCSPAVA